MAPSSRLRRLCAPLLLSVAITASCSSTGPSADEIERQVEIHTETCAGYLAMAEYARAEDQALRGLALEPNEFTLRLYLGRAMLNQDKTEKILRAEQVLDSLPKDEDFRVALSLGEAQERKGIALEQAAEGVLSGERFTNAADPELRAQELSADARAAFDAAHSNYKLAYDLQPNDTEILNGLVRISTLTGNFEDSLAWGEAIIRITESDRLFWKQQLERPNIADREEKRMWGNINQLEELEIAVHLQAAATLNNQLRRPEQALEHLDQIIAFDATIPETYSQKAQLLVKLERYEDAIAAIDQYMRLALLDFDHPDIQRAWRIRNDCEAALLLARPQDELAEDTSR